MFGRKLIAFTLLLGISLLSFGCLALSAGESQDITQLCSIAGSHSKNALDNLSDRDLGTVWLSEKEKSVYISLITPEDQACYGIYICSAAKKPQVFYVQTMVNGEWKTIVRSQGLFVHEYIKVSGLTNFRIVPSIENRQSICLSEIYILSKGTAPSWVQQWVSAPEKIDMMLLVAHPDDELLFFGGSLPYYAGVLKKNVIVAYMTCNTIERRSELLNALWVCGVQLYPDIGDFYDKYTSKVETGYEIWGKTTTMQHVTALFRKYKPDVILSHDINGEYGHGAHRVCADAVQKCISFAANPDKYLDSAQLYGIWQAKKLYLHLYQDNDIKMNWDQALPEFDGLTAYEVAVHAYTQYKTQANASQKNKKTGKYEKFIVEPTNSPYSCYDFGLAFSTVGPDLNKNDFLENVPLI